jgi:hypothetical protein
MAPKLGKRKRVTRAELEQPSRSPSPSSGDDSDDIQERFRRAFEAKFKPLDVEPKKPKIEQAPVEVESESEEDSDWSGLSGDEANKVQVVEYKALEQLADEENAKLEKRAFMSSKPPKSVAPASTTSGKLNVKKKSDEDDNTDASNLKHDLALQKLLRESHLLSSASNSGSSTPNLTTSGIARHKSTDLHLQSLGAKASVFTQKKMPMSQRKHEVAKARTNEEKRRAEAREAGIILEREQRMGKKDADKRRERGVGGPSVGKMRGGTLSLSREDVRSITGGGGSGGRGGSKGRGKGRGGKRGR